MKKKVPSKPIKATSTNKRPAKAAVKKAVEPKEEIKMVPTKNGLKAVKVRESKADNRKFIKVLTSESIERFREMGERVFRKELKWAYYATENSVGAHYYLILNTVIV